MKRKPTVPFKLATGRVALPEGGSELSDNQRKPAFSLEHLQATHCLSKCDKNQKAAFADRLRELSQLTWQQIQQSPRHGQGHEKIAANSIRAAVPVAAAHVEFFLSFRCLGNAPMVGFRRQHIFYVLWIDRDFSVYRH